MNNAYIFLPANAKSLQVLFPGCFIGRLLATHRIIGLNVQIHDGLEHISSDTKLISLPKKSLFEQLLRLNLPLACKVFLTKKIKKCANDVVSIAPEESCENVTSGALIKGNHTMINFA